MWYSCKDLTFCDDIECRTSKATTREPSERLKTQEWGFIRPNQSKIGRSSEDLSVLRDLLIYVQGVECHGTLQNIREYGRMCWKRDDVMEGVRVLYYDVNSTKFLQTKQSFTKEAAYDVTTDVCIVRVFQFPLSKIRVLMIS